MKCPKCEGEGTMPPLSIYGIFRSICDNCHGKGTVENPWVGRISLLVFTTCMVILLTGCHTATTVNEPPVTRYHHSESARVTPLMFKCITVGGSVGCGSAGLDPTCLWQGDHEFLCFTHESEWAWVGVFVNGYITEIYQQRMEQLHG